MKHLILLLCLAVGFNLSATAQTAFSIGPTLVPFSSYAGYSRNFEFPYRYSTGVGLGILAQYNVGEKWSITSGVWYQTAAVKSGEGLFAGGIRIGEKSLAIPLLLNFRPSKRKVSPYFSAGTLLGTKEAERGLAARPMLAAGLSYHFAPQFTLNLQPAFILGANSKANKAHYPANRQISLQAQLLYNFSTKTK